MTDLDDAALKAEIDQISKKIDAIMMKVERLYPTQQRPAGKEQDAPQDTPRTSPGPSG
jgi:hypothetical protein